MGFNLLMKPKFVLKRVLFHEDIEYPNLEKMNELISLNKKQTVKNKDGNIYTEVSVLYSLLRVCSFSEFLNYEKEISKQEAENLLKLIDHEERFVHEVYQLLNSESCKTH